MGARRRSASRLDNRGFTAVEMLVYMVIATVVMAAVYQLLISQSRLYTKQRELQDVRWTLRAAAALLAHELRLTSAIDGDLYDIADNGFSVRSFRGAGFVCGIDSTATNYGLALTTGEFDDSADDSALVYAANGPGMADDIWRVVDLTPASPPVSVNNCEWSGSSVQADLTVHVEDDGAAPTGVEVGAPLKAFRRVDYGLFSSDGRWWLGRKVGSSATNELLAGPLKPPSDSGLLLIYYDSLGGITTDPTEVSMVDIILRGESLGKAPQVGEAPDFQIDTLTMRVSLRG